MADGGMPESGGVVFYPSQIVECWSGSVEYIILTVEFHGLHFAGLVKFDAESLTVDRHRIIARNGQLSFGASMVGSGERSCMVNWSDATSWPASAQSQLF